MWQQRCVHFSMGRIWYSIAKHTPYMIIGVANTSRIKDETRFHMQCMEHAFVSQSNLLRGFRSSSSDTRSR